MEEKEEEEGRDSKEEEINRSRKRRRRKRAKFLISHHWLADFSASTPSGTGLFLIKYLNNK